MTDEENQQSSSPRKHQIPPISKEAAGAATGAIGASPARWVRSWAE